MGFDLLLEVLLCFVYINAVCVCCRTFDASIIIIIIIIAPTRCHGVSHRRATSRYRPLAFEMLLQESETDDLGPCPASMAVYD
jgi:hypothetical protein